ncbi:MAG: helix-turn-helix transcriptional regulator [Candidatus Zambryskibacteria bacterium]|nr:helix-turn-helix transcriptional regulator [Candidatus Zambryskibacteria bacterium]
MSDISAKFGNCVKEIRLRKKLSQGDLAKILGVHPTYISGIERGVRNMSLKNIERLADALGVSVKDLIK